MNKNIFFLLVIFTAGIVYTQNNIDKKAEIKNFIKQELALYPEERLVDLYKSFFQGYWGPGHLIKDSLSAQNYLDYELNKMEKSDTVLVYRLGHYNKYVRLNLVLIKENIIPADKFLSAFLESANGQRNNSIEEWKKEWSYIIDIIEEMNLDFKNYTADKMKINKILKEGKYVMHHSEIFKQKYYPHYRVISVSEYEQLKSYFTE